MADSTPDMIRADMLPRADPKFRFRWERAFRENSGLPATSRLVGLMLATYMDDDGTNAWPGLATLATACSLGERVVSRHLSTLVGTGWLVRTREGRKVGRGPGAFGVPACYVAAIPAGGMGVPPVSAPGGTEVPAGGSQGVTSCPQEERGGATGGTHVHPTEGLYRNQTGPAAAPLQYHLDAIRFGRSLGGSAKDEDEVEAAWKANRTLSRFPDLLPVVVEYWSKSLEQSA